MGASLCAKQTRLITGLTLVALLAAIPTSVCRAWQPQAVMSGGGTKTTLDQQIAEQAADPFAGSWQTGTRPIPAAQTTNYAPRGQVITAGANEPFTQSGGQGSDGSNGQPLASTEVVKRTPLAPPTRKPTGEDDRSSGALPSVISVGSSLLIVIGIFLGTAWCYRRTLSSSISGGLPKQVVQVLGRTPLAARQQLVLVRFGSKLVLISLVQGEARTISEITDPLQVAQLSGMCESSRPGSISSSFRSILTQEAAS